MTKDDEVKIQQKAIENQVYGVLNGKKNWHDLGSYRLKLYEVGTGKEYELSLTDLILDIHITLDRLKKTEEKNNDDVKKSIRVVAQELIKFKEKVGIE